MEKVKKAKSKKYFEDLLTEERNKSRRLERSFKLAKIDRKKAIAGKDVLIMELNAKVKELRSDEHVLKLSGEIQNLKEKHKTTKLNHKKELTDKTSNDAVTIIGLKNQLQISQDGERELIMILKKNNIKA